MRIVFPGEQFILDLNSSLPSVPGGDRPTVGQFTRLDLPDLLVDIGELWEAIPQLGTPGFRRLIKRYRLVWAYQVVACEHRDGSIELTGISFDFEGLIAPEVD